MLKRIRSLDAYLFIRLVIDLAIMAGIAFYALPSNPLTAHGGHHTAMLCSQWFVLILTGMVSVLFIVSRTGRENHDR